MAHLDESGQQASAWTLPSEHIPQFPQAPRPGTPFNVSLYQQEKQRPSQLGTPFTVPEWDNDTPTQRGKHLTSTEDPWHFPPPRVIRPSRRKIKWQKPYEDKPFKVPDNVPAKRLQNLRTLTKSSSSKKTLNPLEELKEISEGKCALPSKVPEFKSNPLSREPRPSALQPDTRKRVASSSVPTRKRVASTSVPIPEKVQKSLDTSTVFEQPMDLDQEGNTVPTTSSRHCAGDTSENFNTDDTVPGPSSADSSTDQRGQHLKILMFAAVLLQNAYHLAQGLHYHQHLSRAISDLYHQSKHL
ncbi:hypothetical protein NN561_017533 [Cricetulus griseus]